MKFNSENQQLRSVVAAALAIVTGPAVAQTLYGGGATLPAPAYVGPANAISSQRLTNGTDPTDDPGSLFAAYTDVFFEFVSYCQTGSGTGKNILDGVAGVAASNPCPSFSLTPTGFGAPAGMLLPDFAASDSPLAATDITAFYANPSTSARVAPVQLPSLAASIAVVFNNTDVPAGQNITTDQICQAFSGKFTNWSQIVGASVSSMPITIVFRSDGSGTSFNFSNHLAAVCSGDDFLTSQNWTGSGGVVSLLSPAPTNQVGASGNPGVVTQVANTPGAIGYAEYADSLAISPTLPHFTVDGQDPTNLMLPALSFTTGMVIAAADNANGTPLLQPVAAPYPAADLQCLMLVDPNSYSAPSTGYSIVAVTYLLGYFAGNGANTTLVEELLDSPYDSSVKTLASEVVPNNGYNFLPFDATANIKSCINK